MQKSSENTCTSTFICRFVPFKEAHPKRKHRKIYYQEKSGHFVFRKTSFFVLIGLGLGFITPYSLGVLI